MQRKLTESIYKHLARKEYTIMAGARQTGKTTMLKQLHERLKEEKKISFYISLEDHEILHSINESPENIFRFITKPSKKLSVTSAKRVYLFIDEVQYAKDPSNFLKYLFDTYGAALKIIATGSSAFYIDKKFKDSLAGRKRLFELYTLDFEEFLDFKKQSVLKTELKKIKKEKNYRSLLRKEIEHLFDEYLIYGGYPAVVLENDAEEKKILLQELVNTYLKRDVQDAGVADGLKFFQFVKILAAQTGGLMNQNTIADTLRLSHGTVENYTYVLRKCFHLQLVPPLYGNIRKEISKMAKVYFNDMGFRNTLLNYFESPLHRIDKGELLENFVYIRLRQLYGNDSIRFWRTADGNEVDFIVQESAMKGMAMEVKFSESSFNKSKYNKFTELYKQYPLRCISYKAQKQEYSILLL